MGADVLPFPSKKHSLVVRDVVRIQKIQARQAAVASANAIVGHGPMLRERRRPWTPEEIAADIAAAKDAFTAEAVDIAFQRLQKNLKDLPPGE